MNETQPIILVFYLDAEMMKNAEMIQPFAESVNMMIEQKKLNMVAFFLPTTGEERIECINPTQLAEPDMARINQMVKDIETNFGMNETAPEIADIEVVIDKKPCECGDNPGKDCKCD